jgi:endonuclease/exonuclease/phosphatase family metal-dependent hydrolase
MLRVMGYNILKNGVGREMLLAEVIRAAAPDVVMLAEAKSLTAVARLAELADYPYFAANGHSTAFMSRIPAAHHWHTARGIRSPFLEVTLRDTPLRVYGIHFLSLLTNLTERVRQRESRLLLQAVQPDHPHLLIGDFNTLAPGDRFDTGSMPGYLRRLIAWQGGDIRRLALKRLLDNGYVDAYRRLHPAETGWTLPSWQPNTRLDYAFLSPTLLPHLHACDVIRTPETVTRASDHLPLLVELNL